MTAAQEQGQTIILYFAIFVAVIATILAYIQQRGIKKRKEAEKSAIKSDSDSLNIITTCVVSDCLSSSTHSSDSGSCGDGGSSSC